MVLVTAWALAIHVQVGPHGADFLLPLCGFSSSIIHIHTEHRLPPGDRTSSNLVPFTRPIFRSRKLSAKYTHQPRLFVFNPRKTSKDFRALFSYPITSPIFLQCPHSRYPITQLWTNILHFQESVFHRPRNSPRQ